MSDEVTVTVVIPSVGRPAVVRAVKSALDQTRAPLEVIVVFDLDVIPDVDLPQDPRVRTLTSGGGRGGNFARGIGVKAARGALIAFLDDDDRWRPAKLERQVDAYLDARRRGIELIVATAAQMVDAAGRDLQVLPRQLPADGQSIPDYLLRRRSVSYGDAMLCSSMLLCSRSLLHAVALDTRSSIHDDWDWLIRAGRHPGVRLQMIAEPLLEYTRQEEGRSVSRSGRWRQSADWFRRNRIHLSTREYGDGLLTVTLPLAVAAGDRRAALSVLGRALRGGRPGFTALAFAVLTMTVPARCLGQLSGAVHRLVRTLGLDRAGRA